MKDKIKGEVKKVYGKIAKAEGSCCLPTCGCKQNMSEGGLKAASWGRGKTGHPS